MKWRLSPRKILAAFLLVAVVAGVHAAPKAAKGSDPRPSTPAAPANPDAAATLVVFNENDRDSEALARFYADKRGIPAAQVVGLACSKLEEITRAEYDTTIADPLRKLFTAKGWWKLREPNSPAGPVESCRIRYVALMRGVPLKIAPVMGYEGDKITGNSPISPRNEAAVDSELATLGLRTRIISGAMNNPLYRSFTPSKDGRNPEVLLVCRLDGPTPEIVRRMITDSIAAEEDGLAGITYVDARGIQEAGYMEGDNWLFAVANDARRRGSPVVLDNGPGLFPEHYPMTRAALYFGWYTEHASGPFVRPDFRFVRGAVAVHIHSFSAVTVRDPVRQWCGPLLAAGAAATVGNVYEPYLALTVQLDVFHDRLRSGLTFGESAYMAQRVLSWMGTCVGDPLYRPFKGAAELEERPAKGEYADYRQAARAWFSSDRATGDEAIRVVAKKNRSGLSMEGLGLLQLTVNDRDGALASFAQAQDYYGKSEDSIRVAIHEILQLKAAGKNEEAKSVMLKSVPLWPHPGSEELLRALTGLPATPPPSLPPPVPLAPATPAPAKR